MAELKFEEALKRLESIVGDLESGNLNLDDAIKKYEEGMKLSNFCRKKLDEIQKKVEMLVKDSSGKLTVKEFKAGEIDEKEKAPSRKKRPKGEHLLF